MKYGLITVGVVLLGLGAGSPVCAWASSDAVVAGVVRDARGTPQMGALVELLGPDASLVGRAFTDDHGRYFLATVLPGNYQLRASAAFLMPVLRSNLRLRAGAHAVADLTMTAVFQTGSWLPAERRRKTEPVDDWQWTLRSTASRPLLRLVDDGSGAKRGGEAGRSGDRPATYDGEATLTASRGIFAEGGLHQVIAFDRRGPDGAVEVVRANFGSGSSAGSAASFSLAGGVERQSLFGGEIRMLASFASHPELQVPGGAGFQVLRSATAEKIILGDSVVVDAGTLFSAERTLGSRFESDPYVRIAFKASPELTIEYRLATNRMLQSTEDLDRAGQPEDLLTDANGQPISQKGLHQELVATHTEDDRVLSVAIFQDEGHWEGVQGTGVTAIEGLGSLPVVSDPSSGTLRFALQGRASSGARVSWTERVAPHISTSLEADLGKVVEAKAGSSRLDELASGVNIRTAVALSASTSIRTRQTGSIINISYRWQPHRTLTQVDEYDSTPNDAFLTIGITQRVWAGARLKGINLVVEATNLLAQGYNPMVGSAGQAVSLAQVPRAVMSGLAFSF